jgi:flagellar hook-basal body complex protein FliE
MDSIQGLTGLSPATTAVKQESPVTKSSNAFGDMLTKMVNDTNQDQVQADQAVEDLQTGKAEHLHEVMISVEEAEMSLKMLVQVRNKALTAYEVVMRMQI